MRIRILFFAALRDRMKCGETMVDASEGETAADLARRVLGFDGIVAYAVNDDLVSGNYVLQSGDTLALIPPMAGG